MKNQATPPRSFNTVRRSNREQRIKRRRCQRVVLLLVFAVVLLILLALIALSVGALIQAISRPEPDPDPDPKELVYEPVPTENSKIHSGELIVVNADHEYVFPAINTLKRISDYRQKCDDTYPYQIKRNDASLQSEALTALDKMLVKYYTVSEGDDSLEIGSTYRSKEEQDSLPGNVKGGFSDHHTGYCLELHSIPSNSLDSNHWIYEHCAEYGFIVRYPNGKSSVTGFKDNYYTNCFRYVGIPHATYITRESLCLEEYIALLQKDYADGNHLKITDAANKNYEVYYVPATANDLTTLSVPSEYRYTVSGDNMKGFIITVYLDEPIKQ